MCNFGMSYSPKYVPIVNYFQGNRIAQSNDKQYDAIIIISLCLACCLLRVKSV